MSWEARIEAQRKALEDKVRAEEEKLQHEERQKKQAVYDTQRKIEENKQKILNSPAYAELEAFTRSNEFKSALNNIAQKFKPETVYERGFLGRKVLSRYYSPSIEIYDADIFDYDRNFQPTGLSAISRRVRIIFHEFQGDGVQSWQDKEIRMWFSVSEQGVTYSLDNGWKMDSYADSDYYRSTSDFNNEEEFLDELARRIVSGYLTWYKSKPRD